MHAAFHAQMQALLRAQPAARQAFLLRTAVLRVLDPAIVVRVGRRRRDAPTVLAALDADGTFVVRHDGAPGYLDAVRDFLLDRLTAEVGAAEVAGLHRRAAELYEARRAMGPCRRSLHRCRRRAPRGAGRGRARRRRPRREPSRRAAHVAQSPAGRRDRRGVARRARAHGRGAAPVACRGAPRRRRGWRRRAPAVGGWRRLVGVVAGLGLWLTPPFEGLTANGMHMLGLLAWAAVFWAFDVLPDYVVGLAMIIGWILFHIVPAEVAVSGFTAGPVLPDHRRARHRRLAAELRPALPPRAERPAPLSADAPRPGVGRGGERHGDESRDSRQHLRCGHRRTDRPGGQRLARLRPPQQRVGRAGDGGGARFRTDVPVLPDRRGGESAGLGTAAGGGAQPDHLAGVGVCRRCRWLSSPSRWALPRPCCSCRRRRSRARRAA